MVRAASKPSADGAALPASSLRFLALLKAGATTRHDAARGRWSAEAEGRVAVLGDRAVERLLRAAALRRAPGERLGLTDYGRSLVPAEAPKPARHRVRRDVETPEGVVRLQVNEAESPLAWLARRKDKSGAPLIAPAALLAGEKLRRDFTRAGLSPRVTADWSRPADGAPSQRGADAMAVAAIDARARLDAALAAAGPEFAGLLLDVCCFLKGLELVEHERGWPTRTARIVLGLALARLVRHYGLGRIDGAAPASHAAA